eukprot:2531810-Prorocentrum_lima.AAC.1
MEVVNVLLSHGASLEAASKRFGGKLVLAAASHGHGELITALLDREANKEAVTEYGGTLLYNAAKKGYLEVVK